MLARLNALAAVAALCASGMGCRAVQCGDACGRGCSMAFQKYDCACEDACGGCCGSGASDQTCDCAAPCAAEGCAQGVCSGRCGAGRGLKGWLSRLCGCNDCGEMYWSEWHNDPPCVYEPCDNCGRYAGGCRCESAAYQADYRAEGAVWR
ncbi:MAG: hypothetical protein IT424_05330 [Pirellulales bacterium]|nr:hypothetical protein [Pirellulales bacterium]